MKPEDCIPDAPGNEHAREFLAHAPTKGLWMPLGKEVKVMQCEWSLFPCAIRCPDPYCLWTGKSLLDILSLHICTLTCCRALRACCSITPWKERVQWVCRCKIKQGSLFQLTYHCAETCGRNETTHEETWQLFICKGYKCQYMICFTINRFAPKGQQNNGVTYLKIKWLFLFIQNSTLKRRENELQTL